VAAPAVRWVRISDCSEHSAIDVESLKPRRDGGRLRLRCLPSTRSPYVRCIGLKVVRRARLFGNCVLTAWRTIGVTVLHYRSVRALRS